MFGNFKQSQVLTNTLLSNVIKRQANGYTHSAGAPVARSAVAKRYCTSETTYTSSDVVIASGCSGALDLAISVLIDEGTNILVPRPGFPLYETIAVARGGSAKHYVRLTRPRIDKKKIRKPQHTGTLPRSRLASRCGTVGILD